MKLPPPEAILPARLFVLPTLRNPYSFLLISFDVDLKGTKINVKGLGMFIHQRLRTGL